MKKLSVLLCTTLLLGLCGCSSEATKKSVQSETIAVGNQQVQEAGSVSEEEPVTLRFMWWGSDSRHQATLKVIEAFQEKYPNVTIEAEYSGSDGYREKLTTQLAAGAAADIIQNGTDWMKEITASGDFFVDFSEYPELFDTSDFEQNFLNGFGIYNDKLVAVPTGVNALTMVLNEKVLADAGIEANQDWTWEKVLTEGKKVHEHNPDQYFMALSSNNLTEFVVRSGIIQRTGNQYVNEDYTLGFEREDLWLIGLVVLQIYPIFASLYYSFTNFSIAQSPTFVGLRNYERMLTSDPDFWNSLSVTTKYVLIAVPSKLLFALFIAIILNSKLRFINVFRTIYYLPSILGGSIAISVVWRNLFMKTGIINQMLLYLGLPAINWVGSPGMALLNISLLTVWQFGSSMVIFLSGLKQIPQELYDAGRVDGASRIQLFFKITLPMLTSSIFFNLVMQMINGFQEFTSAYVITNGGPAKSTYLYGLKLYQEGFNYFKMGYASALSWVLFIIILLLTVILFRTSDKWVYYADGGDGR